MTQSIETPVGIATVGEYATMSIVTDRYILVIEKVTPKTITARHTYPTQDGGREPITTSEPKVFRWNEKRGTFVHTKYSTLTLGTAVEYRDPSV